MKSPRSLAVVGLLVALVLGIVGTATANPGRRYNPDSPPIVTGCIIRFTSSGPVIHDNSWHHCTGADSVSVRSNGDLLLRHDRHGPIISVTVSPDESLSRRNIIAGASNGVNETVIRFQNARTGKAVRADSSRLVCTYCNIWVTWVHAGSR